MTGRAAVRSGVSLCAGLLLVVVLVGATAAHPAPAGTQPVVRDACGIPVGSLAWIDYGEGSVGADARAVLAQPGVIVSTSGTGAIPTDYRKHGAATTYWVLHLPRLIGEPDTPVDPATIPAVAATLLTQAQKSSACATPWIALNELLGADAQPPWSPTTTTYRADLLALVRQLSAAGAHPAVLVHGNPYVGGTAGAWWRRLAASSTLVYEAYYDATHIYPMGAVMGSRRMRMGIDNVVALFGSVGVKPSQLGMMLGFHSSMTPGSAGRQGLEPSQAWFRVIKWEALAALETAREKGFTQIWSWGWGTFGADSADPDKAAALCAYLWTRDPALCDAPAMAGPDFNTSLAEGQIILPPDTACTFANGRVAQSAVDRLAVFTGDAQVALTALFARAAAFRMANVTRPQVLAYEKQVIARVFHGSMQAYASALAQRHATVEIARGVIGDELRRRAIAVRLEDQAPGQTPFETTITHESQLVNTAICADDVLPGTGDFPASDARDIGVVPLAARLPFLFADRTAPAAPSVPTATATSKGVTLTWSSGAEPDLAGYDVYESVAGAPFAKINKALVGALDYLAPKPAAGQTVSFAVRAVDTSGNAGVASPIVTVAAG